MLKLKLHFEPGVTPLKTEATAKVVAALNDFMPDMTDSLINIKVTTAAEVQALNKKYAGKDEATDVLSFNYQEGNANPNQELGDVVVSADHVVRQAAAAQTDESTELALLVLHGALHLIGYDHQTKNDLRVMNDLQREVMMGAGLVYRDFGWQN